MVWSMSATLKVIDTMKATSLTLLAFCLLSCCTACACKDNTVNNTPVNYLDLGRFLGSWYEIARFDHSFERGMAYTKATYSINADGTVRVENTGLKNGKHKKSIGKAKRPDPVAEPALLRVSFFGPFYSDYRVLMIDPDYQYTLISSKGDDYLWILSRTKTLPQDTLDMIMAEARSRGFDTTKLMMVPQGTE